METIQPVTAPTSAPNMAKRKMAIMLKVATTMPAIAATAPTLTALRIEDDIEITTYTV